MHLISELINPQILIAVLGTFGVIAIIFLETGLFFGFFFPGDSLLFTAGFLAYTGHVSFVWLLIGTFIAAVLGDSFGYYFGKKLGPAIFTKDDSVFFNKKHIIRAQHFYEKYGKKTIILARFVPIVRTFAPMVAGVGMMKYRTFISMNIIGGFLWTWALLWFGWGFGPLLHSIDPNFDPDKFIIPVVLVIVLISASPVLWELWKKARKEF